MAKTATTPKTKRTLADRKAALLRSKLIAARKSTHAANRKRAISRELLSAEIRFSL